VSATRVFAQAWRYGRTWGLRAATRRAMAELRNAWRRGAGARRPAANDFDRAAFDAALADPAIEVVVFDLFDTLVERPLHVEDAVHRVVALRCGEADWPQRRAAAEAVARRSAGGEVDLAEIHAALARAGSGDALRTRLLEEDAELRLAMPRAAGVALLQRARAAGKRVVVASDTALPESTVAAILASAGIAGQEAVYVSSSLRRRKSTGALYEHLLNELGIQPGQALMVGDHPLSDCEIPAGLGLATALLPSAAAIAAGFPRFAAWAARHDARTDSAQAVFEGLLARRFFSEIDSAVPRDLAALTQGGRQGIGYAVVGPLLVAFSQWLNEHAAADGAGRLMFVAREGWLMREVFERLRGPADSAPESGYLVLSRRAVSVAAIRSRDDVLDVARTAWLPGTLHDFLLRRFGINLRDSEIEELCAAGLWEAQRRVAVVSGRIDALVPVLDALMERILAQAAEERAALLAYLDHSGVGDDTALVDVGYAATSQARLCELTGRRVHGYYLVTRNVAADVRSRHGVIASACFAQDVATPEDSPLLRYCLGLELMLGADDAQVSRYRLEADGRPAPEFQALTVEELAGAPMRAEIRAGVMDFVDDWLDAQRRIGVPLRLDHAQVVDFFRDFWEGIGATERALLADIAGDDHYCGRGVVRIDDLFGVARG
jgi:FMN phosphatase YigB (HAD superfamily)